MDQDDAIRLLDAMERKNTKPNFELYRSVLRKAGTVREREKLREMGTILLRLLRKVAEGEVDGNFADEEIGELVTNVVEAMCFMKDEQHAVALLKAAEELFVTPERSHRASAIIPLQCYKSAMYVLNGKRCEDQMKAVFHRLQNHYQSGVDGMHPDTDLYQMYMLSLNEGQPTNLPERLHLLKELIRRYEATRQSTFKPTVRMFRDVLSGLAKSKDYGVEAAAVEAMDLIKQMARLEVIVDVNSTNYEPSSPFNIAMELVLRTKEMREKFRTVMEMRGLMEMMNVLPSARTYNRILNACSWASEEDSERALKVLLENFAKSRAMPGADIYTYFACFRGLRHILSKTRTSPRTDKIVSRVFESCCGDGFYSTQAKKTLMYLATPETFSRVYSQRLLDDGKVPDDWRRNAGKFY
jgi:hypothetical protein